jgi:hypothetical protein
LLYAFSIAPFKYLAHLSTLISLHNTKWWTATYLLYSSLSHISTLLLLYCT